MAIKFAVDIISEIEKRGAIVVPDGYVTGEAFERWLYEEIEITSDSEIALNGYSIKVSVSEDVYDEYYGEAA